MKIAVSGASGLIDSKLKYALRQHGHSATTMKVSSILMAVLVSIGAPSCENLFRCCFVYTESRRHSTVLHYAGAVGFREKKFFGNRLAFTVHFEKP